MTLAGSGLGLPSPEGGLIAVDTGGPVLFLLHLKMFRRPHLVEEQESRVTGDEVVWAPKSGLVLSLLP